jgi:REP element-mobilizing transposase RayT
MKDHIHGLFEGLAEDCVFTKFVAMFKQRSGYLVSANHSRKLWQDGYFDHVLRVEEATLDVIAYILMNPVRAGYCSDPREYPFLGSSAYSIDDLCDAVSARADGWQP